MPPPWSSLLSPRTGQGEQNSGCTVECEQRAACTLLEANGEETAGLCWQLAMYVWLMCVEERKRRSRRGDKGGGNLWCQKLKLIANCLLHVDRILAATSYTICMLNPCLSWLLKASTLCLIGWLWLLINSTLPYGAVILKEALNRPFLAENKKTNPFVPSPLEPVWYSG